MLKILGKLRKQDILSIILFLFFLIIPTCGEWGKRIKFHLGYPFSLIIKSTKCRPNSDSVMFGYFNINFLFVHSLQFRPSLAANVDGMVSCGITKRLSIMLQKPFLRATNLRKPLKPACTIPCVGHCC